MADADKAKEADKAAETDKVEDYEKRYKDSQTHITTIEQENKALREAAAKDKELFDAVSQYVDWDAVDGKTKSAATEEDEGYVDKKTLNKEVKGLRDLLQTSLTTLDFRVKHPEMIPYEDIVRVFLGKTDARRPWDERVGKAVENVKKLIESERTKGAENAEKEKKEKAAKEAEAAGLSAAKGPEGKKEEPEGETFDEYLEGRKAQARKAMGLEP